MIWSCKSNSSRWTKELIACYALEKLNDLMLKGKTIPKKYKYNKEISQSVCESFTVYRNFYIVYISLQYTKQIIF